MTEFIACAKLQRFFADYILKNEKAADVIRLSLERLEINQRMRNPNHA